MISLPVLTFMSPCHIVGEAFKDSDFTSSVDLQEQLHEPLSYSHIVGEAFKDSDFTSSVDLHEPLSYSRGAIQGQ